MLRWLRERRSSVPPEALWVVAVEEDCLTSTDPKGERMIAPLPQLSAVAIETNDNGPWGIDPWWLLFGPGGALICAFPGGASGERHVIDWLAKLPGFDMGKSGNAMASTTNATFLL